MTLSQARLYLIVKNTERVRNWARVMEVQSCDGEKPAREVADESGLFITTCEQWNMRNPKEFKTPAIISNLVSLQDSWPWEFGELSCSAEWFLHPAPCILLLVNCS